jgi:HEAT repeat protein
MSIFKPNIDKLKKAGDTSGLARCLSHRNADVRYAAFSALASRKDLNDDIVAKLKSMTGDLSQKVRTITTLKFAGKGDKTVTENLTEIINTGSQNEKIELLRVIASRGKSVDEAIVRVIALAIVDKKELVKLEAIQTAGIIGSSHFVPNLLKCLHDNLHSIRIEAAKALFKIGGPDSIDHLIGLLVDRNPDARTTAYSYLSSIESERARKALHDHNFQQLVNGMNNIESKRKETTEKIGAKKIREGLPLLYTALQDEYKEVRVEALKAIAVFRDPASIPFVAKLLEDKYSDARLEAVKTISGIISDSSLELLENAMVKGDRNVREEARKAVYRLRELLNPADHQQ